MKEDLYFASPDEEMCYPKSYFEAIMDLEELHEMTLYKARLHKIDDFFWCKYFESIGAKSEGACGKECTGYAPRNGKNGSCKYYSLKLYEPSDETFTLRRLSKYDRP